MTMPPILLPGLEIAKKGVSIYFCHRPDKNLDPKMEFFWPFLG